MICHALFCVICVPSLLTVRIFVAWLDIRKIPALSAEQVDDCWRLLQ